MEVKKCSPTLPIRARTRMSIFVACAVTAVESSTSVIMRRIIGVPTATGSRADGRPSGRTAMATWRDFVDFIDRTYKYEILNDDLLKLVFNTSNLRTQLVFLEHATCNSGVEWFKVNSPIGKLTPQQVMYAARRLEDMVVGGIIINDNMVFVTTAMPLENIDTRDRKSHV